MLDPEVLEAWRGRDVDGLKAKVGQMTAELGCNPEAQRRKIAFLKMEGLSQEEAAFFLNFFMQEPNENGLMVE